MKEEDYSKAIEVFSGSPWEAEIIKGLLESNNILYRSFRIRPRDRGRIRSSHRANQKSGRER